MLPVTATEAFRISCEEVVHDCPLNNDFINVVLVPSVDKVNLGELDRSAGNESVSFEITVHLVNIVFLIRIDFDSTAIAVTVLHRKRLGFDYAVLEIATYEIQECVPCSIVRDSLEIDSYLAVLEDILSSASDEI